MDNVKDFLESIGFSSKEADIYIALIKVDSFSILDLSKHTKIGRTTIYPIIENLKNRGFVKEIKKDRKVEYKAETPERIESFLQEQKIKIDERLNESKDILPQIKGIMKQDGESPIVEYAEGRESIIHSAKTNVPNEEVFMIYPRDRLEELFTKKEIAFARKVRIEKQVKVISMYSYSKGEYNPDNTGERYKIDDKKFPIKADIAVFGDRVRMHMLGEKLGTVYIKNKDIADTLRTLFKLAIKGIKK